VDVVLDWVNTFIWVPGYVSTDFHLCI